MSLCSLEYVVHLIALRLHGHAEGSALIQDVVQAEIYSENIVITRNVTFRYFVIYILSTYNFDKTSIQAKQNKTQKNNTKNWP